MVFLASLHVGGGVCASGKLALADISTRSSSGPFSPGRTVVLPRDFVGSRGCEIRALDFFQSLWDWTGITAATLPSCLSDFGAIRSTYTSDLAALGIPGIWRLGFLPRSWQGPKIIYWNTLHIIYMYMYVYMYIYEYMYIYIYIYIWIYANNLNDPRHCFVIGSSSLFCMDVCDHIINVFPVHSLNKRFLIPISDSDFLLICTYLERCSLTITRNPPELRLAFLCRKSLAKCQQQNPG